MTNYESEEKTMKRVKTKSYSQWFQLHLPKPTWELESNLFPAFATPCTIGKVTDSQEVEVMLADEIEEIEEKCGGQWRILFIPVMQIPSHYQEVIDNEYELSMVVERNCPIVQEVVEPEDTTHLLQRKPGNSKPGHPCDKCGQILSSPGRLVQHKTRKRSCRAVKEKERNFSCDVCHKVFQVGAYSQFGLCFTYEMPLITRYKQLQLLFRG